MIARRELLAAMICNAASAGPRHTVAIFAL